MCVGVPSLSPAPCTTSYLSVVAPRAGGVHAPPLNHHPEGRWRICVGVPSLSPAPCTTSYLSVALHSSLPTQSAIPQVSSPSGRAHPTCCSLELLALLNSPARYVYTPAEQSSVG